MPPRLFSFLSHPPDAHDRSKLCHFVWLALYNIILSISLFLHPLRLLLLYKFRLISPDDSLRSINHASVFASDVFAQDCLIYFFLIVENIIIELCII